MRAVSVALVGLAVGCSVLLGVGQAGEARACTIGVWSFAHYVSTGHLFAIGTIEDASTPNATLRVERYSGLPAVPERITFENRQVNTTPSCDPIFEDAPKFDEGRVVVVLERNRWGTTADYIVAGFGQALWYVEDGRVMVPVPSGDLLTPEARTEEEIVQLVEFYAGTLNTPVPSSPTSEPTATLDVPPTATAEPGAVGGVESADEDSAQGLLWGLGGTILGAAGVGSLWWWRRRT